MTTAVDTGSLPPPEASRSEHDRVERVFVWGTWLVLSVAALLFVFHFSANLPFWDEWELVPAMTGDEPMTARWLWQPINEHRLPLVKLILVGLLEITGHDFRAQPVFNIVLLSGMSALLVGVSRRLRGRTSFADAFFPLMLLHWGHYEYWLGTITLNHMLSAFFAVVLLVLVVSYPAGLTRWATVLFGFCLLALPLCGANGLPVVLALAVWLAWTGAASWRRGEERSHSAALMALAAAAVVLVGIYFVGLERCQQHPPPPSLKAWLRTSFQCLSVSFVPSRAVDFWRRAFELLLVPVFAVLCCVTLLGAAWRRPAERLRAWGMLLFLGASLSVAFAIGWGRAGLGANAGQAARYALVMLPVLLTVFLSLLLPGLASSGRLTQMGLFSLALLFFMPRSDQGHNAALFERSRSWSLEQAILAGEPIDQLATEFDGKVYSDRNDLARFLRLLQDARVGPFRLRADREANPPRQESLPLTPAATHAMRGTGNSWVGTGEDPFLVFTLPEPRFVTGVRLRYKLEPTAGQLCRIEVFWASKAREELSPSKSLCIRPEPGTWHTQTLRINDTIGKFRIDPTDGPCEFEIAELMLLVPQDAHSGQAATARSTRTSP